MASEIRTVGGARLEACSGLKPKFDILRTAFGHFFAIVNNESIFSVSNYLIFELWGTFYSIRSITEIPNEKYAFDLAT